MRNIRLKNLTKMISNKMHNLLCITQNTLMKLWLERNREGTNIVYNVYDENKIPLSVN
jgi:hypothetical protein